MGGPRQRSLIVEAMVLVGVVVALVTSFELLRADIGTRPAWLGLLGMFYFLAIGKFAEPFIDLRLPRRLRDVRDWETKGRIPTRMGVAAFGRLLANSPLRWLNASVYLQGGSNDLVRLQDRAAYAEAVHFWALVVFLPYLVWLFADGQFLFGTLFVAVQWPLNLYPVLHLRLLRARLERILAHRAGRAGSALAD